VPRPVFGDGLVFLCSGFDEQSVLAVRPGKGDVTETHVAWTARRSAPLTPSPLLIGDELYLVTDTGIASCLDAKTGKEHWRRRLGGYHPASPVYADGHIYFMSEDCERRRESSRQAVQAVRDKPAGRALPGLDRSLRSRDVRPQRRPPVSDRSRFPYDLRRTCRKALSMMVRVRINAGKSPTCRRRPPARDYDERGSREEDGQYYCRR
jgi:hypothetical protein